MVDTTTKGIYEIALYLKDSRTAVREETDDNPAPIYSKNYEWINSTKLFIWPVCKVSSSTVLV